MCNKANTQKMIIKIGWIISELAEIHVLVYKWPPFWNDAILTVHNKEFRYSHIICNSLNKSVARFLDARAHGTQFLNLRHRTNYNSWSGYETGRRARRSLCPSSYRCNAPVAPVLKSSLCKTNHCRFLGSFLF